MHYQNGRPANLGDWVIGPTHNSGGGIVIGIVTALMPQQGPCNVKLRAWTSRDMRAERDEDGRMIPLGFEREEGSAEKKQISLSFGHDDYADANRLLHVVDGYRIANAVETSGKWDAACFEPRMA